MLAQIANTQTLAMDSRKGALVYPKNLKEETNIGGRRVKAI
jgi:hypothetical protein